MRLDVWMRISDGSSIVGDNVWDLVLAHGLALHAAKLEGGFFGIDLVSLVPSLDVVENSEVLTGFLNGDNVHNSERESGVSSDFAIDLDQAFLVLNDFHGFLSAKSIFQSVSQENAEWDAFSSFVGAS